MNRFANVVSSVLSLFVVGLTVGACSSADSSSVDTGSSQQDLLCQSGGIHVESCGNPIQLPHLKRVMPYTCASSATCWVWPKMDPEVWDPSYPNTVTEDSDFQDEMRAASCGPEFYFTDADLIGVPQTNQDHFLVGHLALCGLIPPGGKAVSPLPSDCGCSAVPAGYNLVYWTDHPASPLGTCSMASCFSNTDQPPPASGLPGEPLRDQQD